MLVSNGVFADGADSAGIEEAVAPIASGLLLGPNAALSGAAGASGIDDGAVSPIVALLAGATLGVDGAVSPIVALLAGATLGVGSLGSTLALADIAAA